MTDTEIIDYIKSRIAEWEELYERPGVIIIGWNILATLRKLPDDNLFHHTREEILGIPIFAIKGIPNTLGFAFMEEIKL